MNDILLALLIVLPIAWAIATAVKKANGGYDDTPWPHDAMNDPENPHRWI